MPRSYAGVRTPHHDYGLAWVDNDALYMAVEKAFARLLGLTGGARRPLPPDPFLIVSQALITDTSFEEGIAFEKVRKVNKSMSNALGNMHQNVLALGDNWENLGTTGGVLDIRTKPGYIPPMVGKPVVAEVKNRFNTIKASEEKNVWDKIDEAARMNNAQGYIFQIIPEHPERYDKMWEVSGRPRKHTVRCCDGATAYEMVFGVKDAIFQFYEVLPDILRDIKDANGIGHYAPMPKPNQMRNLFYDVVPY